METPNAQACWHTGRPVEHELLKCVPKESHTHTHAYVQAYTLEVQAEKIRMAITTGPLAEQQRQNGSVTMTTWGRAWPDGRGGAVPGSDAPHASSPGPRALSHFPISAATSHLVKAISALRMSGLCPFPAASDQASGLRTTVKGRFIWW